MNDWFSIHRVGMGIKVTALMIGVLLYFSNTAWATPVLYSFNTPSGALGNSQSYTNNGITVTATGYSSTNVQTALFGKNDGGDEVGLGLQNDPTGVNEIPTNEFIQLNLTNFWAANPTNVQMSIGSVQSGESWNIFGSNTAGTLGTLLQGGTTDFPNAFALVAGANGFNYISVQAGAFNVLLSTLSGNVNVPEPATLLILGSGLAIAAISRKRIRSYN